MHHHRTPTTTTTTERHTMNATAKTEILNAASVAGWAPTWPISETLKLVRDDAVLHIYFATNGAVTCIRESKASVWGRYTDITETPRRVAAVKRITEV